jgi:hypothetical protein
VDTGRVSKAGQDKDDDPDTKGYTGPRGLGLSVGLTSARTEFYLEKTSNMPGRELINRRRSEETSCRLRREVFCKGGQGSEGVLAPYLNRNLITDNVCASVTRIRSLLLLLLLLLLFKVTFTLEQATKGQRWSRGIALLLP